MTCKRKGYSSVESYRGGKPVNISILEEILLNVSKFVNDNPEVKELDDNPIFVYNDGAAVMEAKIILEEKPVHESLFLDRKK